MCSVIRWILISFPLWVTSAMGKLAVKKCCIPSQLSTFQQLTPSTAGYSFQPPLFAVAGLRQEAHGSTKLYLQRLYSSQLHWAKPWCSHSELEIAGPSLALHHGLMTKGFAHLYQSSDILKSHSSQRIKQETIQFAIWKEKYPFLSNLGIGRKYAILPCRL